MKRLLLGILFLTSIGAVNAQIDIFQDSATGPEVSGTIIDFYVDQFDTTPYGVSFYVENNTGTDQQWRIVRDKQSVPAGWVDQVCWPPTCYPTESTPGNIFITPSTPGNPAPTVVNGTYTTTNSQNAIIKPLIEPSGTNGVALYMYYIMDNNDTYMDSVGVRYNFVLGVEENTPALSVSIAPNPANSFIKVKTNIEQGATIKVVDVLGNVVLKETVMGSSKTINTESFRNGVYFVRIEDENHRVVNRKLIVRH